MNGLEVEHLSVTRISGRARALETIEAVRDVSFDIAPGEIVGLLGPSGSGKSSLLGAIAGTVPSVGRVAWDGEDLSDTPVHLRSIGLVFQDGRLFPHRTVGGNVGFGLEMAHVAPAERAIRVAELLELVGLAGQGHRSVNDISGGERQRVALARSLAPRPRLLLLDEPLSSLDSDLRKRLATDVREVLLATHTTALMVTHDRAEAAAVCSRILGMKEGRLTGEVRSSRR